MRSFVVSLARSPERRAAMAAQLDALRLPYTFFDAIDARRGEAAPFMERVRPDRRKATPLLVGDIGCFASNVLLWQECVRLNEPILIMEDDLGFDPRFPEALRLAEEELARGRLMVRLFGFYPWRTRTVRDLEGDYRLVRYLKGPKGSQCQAISPEGARRLLHHAAVWSEPLDFYLDRYWVHGVPSLAIMPYRVEHLPATSEVGARPEGVFSTRRSLLKLADSGRRRAANARLRVEEVLADFVRGVRMP